MLTKRERALDLAVRKLVAELGDPPHSQRLVLRYWLMSPSIAQAYRHWLGHEMRYELKRLKP